MSDEHKDHVVVRTVEAAALAVSFDRVIIAGMILLLCVTIIISAILTGYFGSENKDAVTFSLALYKDIALIVVGALANSVRHKTEEPKQ